MFETAQKRPVGAIGHEGGTAVVVLNSPRLLFVRFDEDHALREGQACRAARSRIT